MLANAKTSNRGCLVRALVRSHCCLHSSHLRARGAVLRRWLLDASLRALRRLDHARADRSRIHHALLLGLLREASQHAAGRGTCSIGGAVRRGHLVGQIVVRLVGQLVPGGLRRGWLAALCDQRGLV